MFGKILGGVLALLLLAMLIIPTLFHDLIEDKIREITGTYLSSELQFEDSDISFFRHFPSLTLSLEKVQLNGSGPFSREPFLRAEELAFSINIWKLLLSKQVDIDGILLKDSEVDFKVDRLGRVNYNVYTAREKDSTEAVSESDTDLNVDRFRIENANLSYEDQLRGIDIRTLGFQYTGRGTYQEETLDLGSHLQIDNVDVTFEDIDYLEGKRLRANLFTVYNSKTLSIVFEKNDLAINDLQVDFEGKLDFDPDGYKYDVLATTDNSRLEDLISALPPEYVTWKEAVTLGGRVDARVRFTGLNNTRTGEVQEPRIELEAHLRNGRVKHRDVQVPVNQVLLDMTGSVDGTGFEVALDTTSFVVADEFTRASLFARGKQDSFRLKTRIHSELDLDKLQQSLQLPNLSFGGHFNADVTSEGTYQPGASLFPVTDARVLIADGFVKTSFPEPVKDIQLDASLKNTDGTLSSTSLVFGTLTFDFVDNPFDLKASVKNFKNLDWDIEAKGSMDLESLNELIAIPGLNTKGFVRLDAGFKGRMVPAEGGGSPEVEVERNSGTLFLENITLTSEYIPKPILIESGDFTFNLVRLDFKDFIVRYASNYSVLNGYFTNYLPYLLLPEGVLGGEFSYKSELVDLGELIPTKEALPELPADSIATTHVDSLETREAIAGVIQVNPNIDFRLNLDVDTLRYFKLDMTDLSGELTVTDGGLILNDGRLKMVGGSALMEGYYRPVGKEKALFSYQVKAQNLDVKRAYEEIELFHELVPAAEKAAGIISLDYQISGSLDGQMMPELPSLEGGGTMLVHDVQFSDYKLFGTVSKQTKFNSLKDPKMKEIKINSTIDNNLLTMERFKFKVRPFRLRMEGETSLDGDLNLQMRVGLPPFGIIGIPIKITGNSAEMQVKMGKRRKELEELDYEEDDLSEEQRLRFNLLRDSISEDMSIDEIQALEKRMDSIDLRIILQKPDSLRQNILMDSLQLQQRVDSLQIPTSGDSIPAPRVTPDSLRN